MKVKSNIEDCIFDKDKIYDVYYKVSYNGIDYYKFNEFNGYHEVKYFEEVKESNDSKINQWYIF